MKNLKKASKRTISLLAVAAVLLVSGGVMSARAIPGIQSDIFDEKLNTAQNGVALVENESFVSENKGVLKLGELTDAEGNTVAVIPGRTYKEDIRVQNTTSTDEYVRVIVRKYWKNEDGKATDLDPALIKLEIANPGVWVKDESATTKEKEVYYYTSILKGSSSETVSQTPPLISGISIDGAVLSDMSESHKTEGSRTVYTYKYKYNGYSFCIEAEAQAVQTHNAKEAIKSVWGVDASEVGINL